MELSSLLVEVRRARSGTSFLLISGVFAHVCVCTPLSVCLSVCASFVNLFVVPACIPR